jgi:putative DNA primase/helicase
MLEFARQAMSNGSETASKYAGNCLNSQRITAAMREAEPHLIVTVDQLDREPYLLNFKNGTVDLRTGEIRPHNPEDLITKSVPHCYQPAAACPRFLQFIRRVLPGLEDYLQKALGYSLTAVTSEKAVFVCHGGGNNGKTTLLATVREVVGDYYAVLLQIDTLMARAADNNSQADLADLRGARFVMTSETEENQRLAEGRLKRITQGLGRIKAVRKYENPIEFTETHKLWMDCNHKPLVRGNDQALWNRLHLIPFDVTIPADEIDRDLPAKLLAESEGILAWMVAGAVRWHSEGLGKPAAVESAGVDAVINIPGNPLAPVRVQFVVVKQGKEIYQVVDGNAVTSVGTRVE